MLLTRSAFAYLGLTGGRADSAIWPKRARPLALRKSARTGREGRGDRASELEFI